MNKNNRNLELSINRLALTLESLEEYIRHTGHYSDWANKEQFYRRTIGDSNKWDLDNDEDHFFSCLSISQPWFKDEPESIRKEAQKEFYKWIDYSRITAENCPEKLKYHLNEMNEMLEGRGDRFRQAYQKANEEFWELIEKGGSVFWQANQEVTRFFFGDPTPWPGPKKIRDFKIEGNAEQGQKTFQQIKNSIANQQPEWTFPWKEKYDRKLKEKIKELEEKDQSQPKIQNSPKDSTHRLINLETLDDTLRTLELYIQKNNYYYDWKISEWIEKGEDWRKNWEHKSSEEIKKLLEIDLKALSLMLRQFRKNDPDFYPNLIDELKIKLSQWQSERKINPKNNCPEQLKQIFLEIDQVLEGKIGKISKNKQEEELAKVSAETKLEIAESNKNVGSDSELNKLEVKLIGSKSVSEARDYQKQIRKRIKNKEKQQKPAATNENENKLSLSVKLAIGGVIIGLVLGTMFIVYRVIKNKETRKK